MPGNSTHPQGVKFEISNPQNGEFRVDGTATTEFTQADINAGNVEFVHDGGENPPSFELQVTDGFNTSNAQIVDTTSGITFTNVNDIPELTGLASEVSFNENSLNQAAEIVYTSASVTDVDSADFNGGSLTIEYSTDAKAEDQLTVVSNGSIGISDGDISYNGTVIGSIDENNDGSNGNSLIIKFTTTDATPAAVKALIENLNYQNTSDTPEDSRTISIKLDDGDGGTSDGVETIIKVAAENDAPVNKVPTEVVQVSEDQTLTFGDRNISISDVDAGSNPVRVTLEATNGNLNLNSTAISNLIFTTGDGTDDATLEFTGSVTDINTALDGMTFQPEANYNGGATVNITTNDEGNSGAGVNLTDSSTVNIDVIPINDAPVNTVPTTTQTIKEDTDLVFNGANNNLIRIDDVDADDSNGTKIVEVTLSVVKGRLTLSQETGLNFESGSNNSSNMTIRGQVGDINSALDGLIYRGNLNANGDDTLSITTNDLGNYGNGGNKTDADLIDITISPVNDAPVTTVPLAQNIAEDTNLIFSTANSNSIAISDVDVVEGSEELEVTLSVNQGVLTLADTTDITFVSETGNGTSNFALEGTINAINRSLNGLIYRGNQDFNGSDTLTINTSDLGHFGEGGVLNDQRTVDITVTPVNDVSINIVPDAQSINEETDLVFSKAAGNNLGITDIDLSEGGDLLEVILTVNNGTLVLGETAELTSVSGNNSATVTITGNQANINNALEGLTYRGSENFNGNDILKITTNDLGNTGSGGSLMDEDTVEITVNPVNDAPVNTVPATQTVNEDTDLALTGSNAISVSDIDAGEDNGEVEITLSVSNGVLNLTKTDGISFDESNGNGNSTVTFKGKIPDVNIALNSLIYRGNLNFNGKEILTISTNDLGNTGLNGALVDTDTVEINVNAVNDAPVNAVPNQQSVDEDKPLVFNSGNGNTITLSDIDVNEGTGEVQIQLSVTSGLLTLGNTFGLNFSEGDGTEDASMTFTGTIDNVNTAFEGLIYQGNENFNGSDTLTIITDDQGNTGIGGNLIDNNTIEITVNAVNDAPSIEVPLEQSVAEDTQLLFVKGNNGITISDVDFDPNINKQDFTDEVQVTLGVEQGTLTLDGNVVKESLELSGDGSNNLSLKGSVGNINAALDNLAYQAQENYNGKDTLTITTNDQGNTGSGVAEQAQSIVDITVEAVNDAPVNTVPESQTVTESRDFVFSQATNNQIVVGDVDVNQGTGELEVSLSVNQGILTLADKTNISFLSDTSDGSSNLVIKGTLAGINTALDGLTYRVNQEFSGTETLTITTTDLGNFGEGGVKTDSKTVDIQIPDTDGDGINDANEKEVDQTVFNDNQVVGLFADEAGTTKPILISISDREQKPSFKIKEVKTENFDDNDSITLFDDTDPRKSALQDLKGVTEVIDFEIDTGTGENEEPELVKLEVKLPENVEVDAILLRNSDGTFYDFNRKLNPEKGQLDEEFLTGAVLEDRNFDGIPDWAVLYLQDGKWGDGDGFVAVDWDFGTSSVEVDENGLTFNGNRSYVEFSLTDYKGERSNEVGFATVRFGDNGEIIEVNGKAVSSPEEAKQAILEDGEILFSSLASGDKPDIGIQSRTVPLGEGEKAVFFMIEDGTRDELLSQGLDSKPIKFSVSSLNDNNENIFQAENSEDGTTNFSLAELFDINAKILSSEQAKSQLKQLALPNNSPDGLIDLNSHPGFDGKQVKLTFSLQREAVYNNSVYLYEVENANGSILDPITGSLIDPTVKLSSEQQQRYLELATSQQLLKDVKFNTNNLTTTEVSITVDGGGYYAPLMVSNGNLADISNDYSGIFTSYMGVNSDGVDHIRSFGSGVYGFEDIVGGGDFDYDDMILSLTEVEVMS